MSDREYYQCRYCGKRTWIRKGSGVYQLPHGGTGCPARGKVNGHAIDHEWRRVGM